ncbi:hypothetical protein K493DRAFT_302740 [Basidiobolus meristosporus CBS 931.73]|uniref:Arrestin C-terminal-like domain-containing protein n=1 Tax=Basidiobolus meristosporus CBS 931.73 TaxID=1314790 RepID=A0A1Y1Y5L8_9FUNG|nr:hypothetical protein K493DRAFT_302740 [Basidiobolus meristosporus CBS 931.73]|eukprot:ORX93321.1 hypothetical protein K493DRAFT_302740 [Basidiobolus meristosporus CBS 931.73]
MLKRVRRDSSGLLSEEGLDIGLHHDILTMHGSPNESVGCVLSGTLNFNLVEPLKVKSISLKFIGKVKIDGSPEFARYEYELIQHKWVFLEASQDSYTMAPRSYSYDFELHLRGNLPESVVVNYGKIYYRLVAVVERPAFRFDIKKIKDVDIKRAPLFSTDSLLPPTMASGIWSENLAYHISIPDITYTIGESFPVVFNFCLLDPTFKIREVSLILREFILYNIEGSEPVSREYDISGTRRRCPGESELAWDGIIKLRIPRHTYSDCESKYITVLHKFFVEIELEEANGDIRVLHVLLRVGIQSAIQSELSQSPPMYQPITYSSGAPPPPYSCLDIVCA